MCAIAHASCHTGSRQRRRPLTASRRTSSRRSRCSSFGFCEGWRPGLQAGGRTTRLASTRATGPSAGRASLGSLRAARRAPRHGFESLRDSRSERGEGACSGAAVCDRFDYSGVRPLRLQRYATAFGCSGVRPLRLQRCATASVAAVCYRLRRSGVLPLEVQRCATA